MPSPTNLHDAAIQGDVDAVNKFLDSGADVNARYADQTALMMAATAGQAAVVRLLLQRGADPNATDDTESTALSWVMRYGLQMQGGIEAARLLLEHGADPNLPDEMGETPLTLAATEGNAEALRLVLEHGADIKARDSSGSDAFISTAACNGNIAALQLLLEAGADINSRGAAGWTGLRHSIHNTHVEGVRFYLSHGADASILDDEGESMLDLARERGNEEIIKLLKDAGAR